MDLHTNMGFRIFSMWMAGICKRSCTVCSVVLQARDEDQACNCCSRLWSMAGQVAPMGSSARQTLSRGRGSVRAPQSAFCAALLAPTRRLCVVRAPCQSGCSAAGTLVPPRAQCIFPPQHFVAPSEDGCVRYFGPSAIMATLL